MGEEKKNRKGCYLNRLKKTKPWSSGTLTCVVTILLPQLYFSVSSGPGPLSQQCPSGQPLAQGQVPHQANQHITTSSHPFLPPVLLHCSPSPEWAACCGFPLKKCTPGRPACPTDIFCLLPCCIMLCRLWVLEVQLFFLNSSSSKSLESSLLANADKHLSAYFLLIKQWDVSLLLQINANIYYRCVHPLLLFSWLMLSLRQWHVKYCL